MTVWPEIASSAFDGSHGLPVSASMPMTSLPPATGVSGDAGGGGAGPPAGGVAAPPPAAVVPALLPLSSLPHAAATRPRARPAAANSIPVRRLVVVGRCKESPPTETQAPSPALALPKRCRHRFALADSPPRTTRAAGDPRHMNRQAEPRTAVATVSMRAHCSPVNASARAVDATRRAPR